MIRSTMIHHDLDVDVLCARLTSQHRAGVGSRKASTDSAVGSRRKRKIWCCCPKHVVFVDDERETNLMNKTNEQKQIDIPDIRFCLGKLTIWHRGCLQKTDGDFLFAFQVSGKAICNSRVKVIFLRREDFKRSMEFRKSAVLSLILMNMKSNMVDSPFIRPAISWGGKRWTQLLEMDGKKF